MKEQAFICRFCLTEQGRCVNLFEHYVPSEKVFLNQLASLMFGLKILKNDGITDKICLACFLKTYQTFFFRRKCLCSEKALLKKLKKSRNISLVQKGLDGERNERPVHKGSVYAQDRLGRKIGKGSPSEPIADKDVSMVPSKEVLNIHQKTHTCKDCHCHLPLANDTGSAGWKKSLTSNRRTDDGTTDSPYVIQSHTVHISQENIIPFEISSLKNGSPSKPPISKMAAHRTLSNSPSVSENYQERNSEFLAFLEKAGQKSINKELLDLKFKHQNLLLGKRGHLQEQTFDLKEDDSHKNSEIDTLSNQDARIRIKSSSAFASDLAEDNDGVVEEIPALIPAINVNYTWQDSTDIGRNTEPNVPGGYKNRDNRRGISTNDIASLNTITYEDISDLDDTFDSSNGMVAVSQVTNAKADQDMDVDCGYHSEFIRFLNSNISDQDCITEVMNEAYKSSLQEVLILNKKSNDRDISYNHQNIQYQDEVKDVSDKSRNDDGYLPDNPVEETSCIRYPIKNNLQITSKDNYRKQNMMDHGEKDATSYEDSLKKSVNPSFCHKGLVTDYDSDAETVSAFPLQSLRKETSAVKEVSVNKSSLCQANKVRNNPTLIGGQKNLSLLQKGCSSFIGIKIKNEGRLMEDVTQQEVNNVIQEINSESSMQSERSSSVAVSKICVKEKKVCAETGSKVILDAGKSAASVDLNDEEKEMKPLQIKVKEESGLSPLKNNEDSVRQRKYHESAETKSAKTKTSDSVGKNTKEALDSENPLLCLTCKKCFTSSDLLLQHVLQHIEEESFDDFQFGDTSKIAELHSLGKTPTVEEEIEILWDSVKSTDLLRSSYEDSEAGNNETLRSTSSRASNDAGCQESDSNAETSLDKVDEDCSVVFIGKCPEDNEKCNKASECLSKKSPGRSNSNSVIEDHKQPLIGSTKSRSVSPVRNSDASVTEIGRGNTLANQNNDPSVHRSDIGTLSHKSVSSSLCRESKFNGWLPEQKDRRDKFKIPFLEKETVNGADEVEGILNGASTLEIRSANTSCDKMKSSFEGCNSMKSHVDVSKGDSTKQSSKIESSIQKIPSQNSKIMVKSEPVTLKETSSSLKNVTEDRVPSKSDVTLFAVDGSKSEKSSLQVKSEPACSDKHLDPHLQEESYCKLNPALYHSTKPDTHSKQDNNNSLEPLLKEKDFTEDPKRKNFSTAFPLNGKRTHSASFHSRGYGQSKKDKKDNTLANKSDSIKLHKISNLNAGVSSEVASSDYNRGNAECSASNISISESSVEKCQKECTSTMHNENVGVSKQCEPISQEHGSIMVVNQCSNDNSAKKGAVKLHNIQVLVTRKNKRRRKRRKKRDHLEVQKNGSSFSFPCSLCSQTFSSHGILLQHMSIHKSSANNQQKGMHEKESNTSIFKSRQQISSSNHYLTECQSKRSVGGSCGDGNFQIIPRASEPTIERERFDGHARDGEDKSVTCHYNAKKMKSDVHSNEISRKSFSKFGDSCQMRGNNLEIRHNFHKHNIITPSHISHSNKFMLGQNASLGSNLPQGIQAPSKVLNVKGANDSNVSYNAEASNLNRDQRNLCFANNSNVIESSGKHKHSKGEHLSPNSQIPIPKENLSTNQSHSSEKLVHSSDWAKHSTEEAFGCWICGKSFSSAQMLHGHADCRFQSVKRPTESNRILQQVTTEVTSQPNVPVISDITKASFSVENKSTNFFIGHSSGNSSGKLEISLNRQVTPGLCETNQRREVIESKIEGCRMMTSQPNVPVLSDITRANFSVESQSSNFFIGHSSGNSSGILEISLNRQIAPRFSETYQRGEIMESKIHEGRRMIQNKLAVNDFGPSPSENKSFRCPACFMIYANWSLVTSHIVTCHNELSNEWPMSLLFIPEIYQKMNEISDSNLGPMQAEVDSSGQELFTCEFCDKLFVSNAALLKHKIWFHNVSPDVGI